MNMRSGCGLQIQAWESRTKSRALVSNSLFNSQRYKSCLPTSTGMDEWTRLPAAPEDERKQTESHSNQTQTSIITFLSAQGTYRKTEASPKSCEAVSDLQHTDGSRWTAVISLMDFEELPENLEDHDETRRVPEYPDLLSYRPALKWRKVKRKKNLSTDELSVGISKFVLSTFWEIKIIIFQELHFGSQCN